MKKPKTVEKSPVEKAPRPKPSALHAVYNGQVLRGHVLSRGREFEAYGADGKPLGTFSTERDAADAISRQGSAEDI
jgi:hypothetical protein